VRSWIGFLESGAIAAVLLTGRATVVTVTESSALEENAAHPVSTTKHDVAQSSTARGRLVDVGFETCRTTPITVTSADVAATDPGAAGEPRHDGCVHGTVKNMTSWSIENATLSFRVPTEVMLAHGLDGHPENLEGRLTVDDYLSIEEQLNFEELGIEELGVDELGVSYHDVSGGSWFSGYDSRTSVEHRVWWWEENGCDGGLACVCGRLTLLEALERLEPGQRGRAVRLHADEMRNLYDHFWSGQGLVSGARIEIGNACVHCLTEGASHVWDVYENACILAEEFGEALAAYAYELMVGEPRFQSPGGHRDSGVNGR